MSVQPFPQLLPLYTHTHTLMHTPTHLSFLSSLYVHRVNGVIQESQAPGSSQVNTVHARGWRHRKHCDSDKCGSR